MQMYDSSLTQPMREELVRIGFQELRTPADVDAVLGKKGATTLLVVNSVCGCAAGSARPGVALALKSGPRPDQTVTVFAGQDREATAQARSYLKGYAPSSPSMAILRDGEPVWMLERHQIEGRDAATIAKVVSDALAKHTSAA